MKRCYIYARVSTAEQNKGEITSIENQIETCQHFIAIRKEQGWEHVKTVVDPGFSGKDLDRPGIKELMAEVELGNVDAVITYKVDRVSRSLIKFYEFNKLLESKKVEFASATQSFDTSSSSGRLMLNILLSFAEYERELISERTSDKMQANFERGKWGGGFIPYGFDYHIEKKELTVNKKEAKAIKLMFESIAAGMTLSKTAKRLAEEGHLTKSRVVTRKNGKQVNIGGKKFREDSIHRMIKNPFYYGYMIHNGQLGKHRYEKLISKTLYEKANAVMKKSPPDKKIKINPETDKHHHLLKGLLVCKDCGCSMTPTPSGKKDKDGNPYLYYVCTEVGHYKKASSCNVRRLPARLLENTIIEYLKQLSQQPKVIHEVIKASTKECSDELKKLLKKEDSIRKELVRNDKETEKFIQIIKDSPKATKRMSEEVSKLADMKDALTAKLEKICVELNVQNSQQLERDTVQETLARFGEYIHKLSMEEKKQLINLLIKEVRIESVNHKKVKAPAEAEAFISKLRTSWFRFVVTMYAIPSIPVSYDENSKKFAFTSKWLPGQDSNLRQSD